MVVQFYLKIIYYVQKKIYFINVLKQNKYCNKIFDKTITDKKFIWNKCNVKFNIFISSYIALFLCLFSLISSMSINIYEQTKEIGIYRSLGLTKYQIHKIYIYESLISIFLFVFW